MHKLGNLTHRPSRTGAGRVILAGGSLLTSFTSRASRLESGCDLCSTTRALPGLGKTAPLRGEDGFCNPTVEREMSLNRARIAQLATMTILLLGVVAGCQVPPVPERARSRPDSGTNSESITNDGYDPWAYRYVTGWGKNQSAANPAPASGTAPGSGGAGRRNGHCDGRRPCHTTWCSDRGRRRTREADGPGTLQRRLAIVPAEAIPGVGDEIRRGRPCRPDSPLEEDSLFFAAESLFHGDQYRRADETYQRLVEKHGGSRFREQAVARQFEIGRYWLELDAARLNGARHGVRPPGLDRRTATGATA